VRAAAAWRLQNRHQNAIRPPFRDFRDCPAIKGCRGRL
jgi:hypothetical protein